MLAWWRGVMHTYPGGVVTLAVAARILGVSRQWVVVLVDAHRLPLIDDMPGGTLADRFVPLDSLLAAPMSIEIGRPQSVEDDRIVPRTRTNPWMDLAEIPQSLENWGLAQKKSYEPGEPSVKHGRTDT